MYPRAQILNASYENVITKITHARVLIWSSSLKNPLEYKLSLRGDMIHNSKQIHKQQMMLLRITRAYRVAFNNTDFSHSNAIILALYEH